MLRLFFFVLMTASLSAFADDRILLVGRPVILIPESTYYRFPSTYTPMTSYHFINISGDNRVCFLNEQLKLKSLDLLRVYIVQNNQKFLWYCYRYNTTFFKINF